MLPPLRSVKLYLNIVTNKNLLYHLNITNDDIIYIFNVVHVKPFEKMNWTSYDITYIT